MDARESSVAKEIKKEKHEGEQNEMIRTIQEIGKRTVDSNLGAEYKI